VSSSTPLTIATSDGGGRDVKTIVTAERLRARRVQTGVRRLVERLMAE